MAEERDRSKRYSNPPKAKKKAAGDGSLRQHEGKAEAKADTAEGKEASGKGPTDAKPGAVGKVGSDKGPSASESGPEFGVVHERHKREHGDTMKRHADEVGAHAKAAEEMHARHHKELGTMHERHGKELQDHMEAQADGEADRSAGKPAELGKAEPKGEKGSNA